MSKESFRDKTLQLRRKAAIAKAIGFTIIFLLCTPIFYKITYDYFEEDMLLIAQHARNNEPIPEDDLKEDVVEGTIFIILLNLVILVIWIVVMEVYTSRTIWVAHDHAEKMQREFSENASHELQTPLAVMRAEVEELMQEDLTERQMRLVGEINGNIRRVSRLNKALLLLAKIDNQKFSSDDTVDTENNLLEVIEGLKVIVPDNFIQFVNHRPGKTVIIKGNEVLFNIMLNNLLMNAVRHTPEEGEIVVNLTNKSFSVANTTTDAEPLDTDTLFLRFGKAESNPRGNSLGLPIVKSICDFHSWPITYALENGMHKFTIMFA